MLRNKLIAAGVGIVMAIALACLGAALDGFAPRGSALGFACRTVPMILAIPLVLVAFNFLCDRWERHDGEATDALEQATPTQPFANAAPRCGVKGEVIGRVTRSENFRLHSSDGIFSARGSRFTQFSHGMFKRTRRGGGL